MSIYLIPRKLEFDIQGLSSLSPIQSFTISYLCLVFHFNLLSVHKLCIQLSNILFFTSSYCLMEGPSVKSPILLGERKSGLYFLKNKFPIVPTITSFPNSNSSFNSFKDVSSSLSCISVNDVERKLWHVRLSDALFNYSTY